MGKSAVEEAKKKQYDTEEHLSWATEKAKEAYDAAKNEAEETVESAKDTITSNYEAAKQKSKKIKDNVAVRGRDEEL